MRRQPVDDRETSRIDRIIASKLQSTVCSHSIVYDVERRTGRVYRGVFDSIKTRISIKVCMRRYLVDDRKVSHLYLIVASMLESILCNYSVCYDGEWQG